MFVGKKKMNGEARRDQDQNRPGAADKQNGRACHHESRETNIRRDTVRREPISKRKQKTKKREPSRLRGEKCKCDPLGAETTSERGKEIQPHKAGTKHWSTKKMTQGK